MIESFDYPKEKALEEIKALDLGVKDIEKNYEKSRANLEEEYSSVAVGSVVKKVIEDVREQKPYLASLINKPNELNSEIESITQQSLIKNAKLEIEKINLSFSKDFHAEFESLNNTQLPSDLSVNLEHGIELGINALSVILSKIPVTRPFALILQGLKPLLKDLLTLLPNIINSFFRNEEKERAKLENLIEVKVIPEVQHSLKKVLPGLFNEALENSLKSLKDRCELEITHKKQEIALAQKEKEKHLNDLEAQKLIQKNALVEKVIKEQGLQEKAGPFISENAVIKTEELEKTIKGMQAENRGLKVGIIGRVKAGKSSLLNALIFEGKDVLPKAATPMTASLTILKYAQNLSAEAQFYDEQDIEELKRDHERYEKEFKEIVSEEVKKIEEKQQGLLNKAKEKLSNFSKSLSRNKSNEEVPKERILSDEEILKKAQKIAKNELDNDAKLSASHDQYERMKKSGLINPKDLETRIQADSLEELNQKLYQFVGKEGKYMPYTKAVQISLNNPNLKDLEIIDTPGVNDPIVSREVRTKALLKECDVVFVIIPSGNFLTDSDMDLFDRVSNKEGIQRVYFVASQADSAVCAPSEVENSRHHLPTALTNTQKILSSSLNATMSLLEKKYPHQQEIFESAKKTASF
ncbi:hypothetical protein BTM273_12410 [Helicobacter pylori]